MNTKGKSCQICGSTARRSLRRAMVVRAVVADLIRQRTGSWDDAGWICLDDLQRFRHHYVEDLLRAEKGEVTQLDKEVLESLKQQEIMAVNPDVEFEEKLTLGQRVADRVATFGGSWTFLSLFGLVMVVWIVVNTCLLRAPTPAFDPFPFIFLNLVLSCLAAIQAPVIMMSQNRQESRDRARSVHDYQVNLKAELEIRQLHQKMDHLLTHQWERLVEIQEIQMELINEIRSRP